MRQQALAVTIDGLRRKSTARRIKNGERLVLIDGKKPIADIVPRVAEHAPSMQEILKPILAASKKVKGQRNLILEDRARLRR